MEDKSKNDPNEYKILNNNRAPIDNETNEDVFNEANKKISNRMNEYQKRFYDQQLSESRNDPFSTPNIIANQKKLNELNKNNNGNNNGKAYQTKRVDVLNSKTRGYREVMKSRELKREKMEIEHSLKHNKPLKQDNSTTDDIPIKIIGTKRTYKSVKYYVIINLYIII